MTVDASVRRRVGAAIVLLAGIALAQDLPPQPDLDLPVRVEGYQPGAPGAVPRGQDDGDDPRDEPPPVFFGEEIETANDTLVYVIDVSGSMLSRDRLLRAQAEAVRSIAGLPQALRFNVVAYDCGTSRLWTALRAATPAAKTEATAWVWGLCPQGGTGTAPAVALALSDRAVMAVVLLTDGAPNCPYVDPLQSLGPQDLHRQLIRSANVQRAAVTVFGIGAWGEFRAFCQGVASDSGGAYVDVPDVGANRGKSRQ